MSVEIVEVARLVPHSAQNCGGLLLLSFENTSQIKFDITFAKIPYLANPVRAEVSTLSYIWRDKFGKQTLEGILNIADLTTHLEPKHRKMMQVPISVPNEAGQYSLEVIFDNRMVEKIVASSSTMDYGFYFKANAKKMITLDSPD